MTSDVVLQLDAVTKRFGPLTANDAISLTLHQGEILALLGEDGAGKTTLMNILFGHYVADEGAIRVFGEALPPGSPREAIAAGIGMVHQHFTLGENLTALDNIVLGTESLWSWRQHKRRAREKLARLSADFGLSVHPDARIADLSVGERQRVEILKALYRDARILILDEPTAVLTPQEVEALFATLKKMVAQGLSIIFISHKLNEVMAVADRVAVLRQGAVVADFSIAETSKEGLAALMVGREIAQPERIAMPAGDAVLELEGVTVAGPHGKPLLDGLDLSVRAHEIVGIAGVSGNGQAALAELISGLLAPESGSLRLYGQAVNGADPAAMVAWGVGRVPEDRHAVGCIGDFSVKENLILE
ncbi:MAG: ATP-binding cassette domain-containing protein, partial [Kiloniellales bacterium]|nr:ATP-binding cassette domain-containing protein [Kiloniellales bacterium]